MGSRELNPERVRILMLKIRLLGIALRMTAQDQDGSRNVWDELASW